jgi:molybdenum cofactor cytidylyltransferase
MDEECRKPEPFPGIVGVLLAAGVGRRFDPTGRNFKLLARVNGHGSMLHASAGKLLAAVDEMVVVHGPRSLESYADVDAIAARHLSCLHAAQGVGRSLQSAVACSTPRLGWLVALADMPFIAASTYTALCDALRRGALLARPVYKGRPGHPVALAVSLRADVMALAPEQGAAPLFKAHRDRVTYIDVDDAGCIADVDTPEALERAPD